MLESRTIVHVILAVAGILIMVMCTMYLPSPLPSQRVDNTTAPVEAVNTLRKSNITPYPLTFVNESHVPQLPLPNTNANLSQEYIDQTPVVLVHLGVTFPWHVYDCVDQLRVWGVKRIVFIYDSDEVRDYISEIPNLECYRYVASGVRETIHITLGDHGLWSYSLERFFALREFFMACKVDRCVHMEHDNLLYVPYDHLLTSCVALFGDRIAVPRDAFDRCIASLVYIGSLTSLESYLDFLKLQSYKRNDMQSLCDYLRQDTEHIVALPVVPDSYETTPCLSEHMQEFGGIFDAAALGQWVGGIDTIHDLHDTRGFVNETAIYQLSVVWTYDEVQRRIPLVEHDGKYCRVFNLHIHSKRLHRYLSRPQMHTDDLIQGQKFQAMAASDFCFSCLADFERAERNLHLLIHTNHTLIYVKTDLLDIFVERIWPHIQGTVVLLTHNADHCVTDAHRRVLLEDPRLLHWFAQNCQITHAKLTPIPIGLANSEYEHGDLSTFRNHMRSYRKQLRLYVNCSIGTHPIRRQLADFMTSTQHENGIPSFVRRERVDYTTYLADLSDSMLVSAPRGNGPDTHRLWEALYMGCVPVTYDGVFQTIPCIPLQYGSIFNLDDWSSWHMLGANPDTVLDDVQVFSQGRRYLRMSYWRAEIRRRCQPVRPLDVAIPVHSKDFPTLSEAVYTVKRWVNGCRNIFIITNLDPSVEADERTMNTRWNDLDGALPLDSSFIKVIHDSNAEIFPFTIQEVDTIIQTPHRERLGWYLQQLLKLYAGNIPGISPRFLVWDSDSLLCRFTNFEDAKGRPQYNYVPGENDLHKPYFTWLSRLLPDMQPLIHKSYSGITHHMILDQQQLKRLFGSVEGSYATRCHENQPFWKIFLKMVDPLEQSGASEFELYFHWMCHFAQNDMQIRKLNFYNTGDSSRVLHALDHQDVWYVSYHSYLRNSWQA